MTGGLSARWPFLTSHSIKLVGLIVLLAAGSAQAEHKPTRTVWGGA